MASFLYLLRTYKLIAIVRGSDAKAALRTVLTLAEEGVALVEVSLTTPDATSVIARACATLGTHTTLGAGTVLSAEAAAQAESAGASFVVTPTLGLGADAALARGLPALIGAFTPTEVARAVGRGATAVKLFPASLGGIGYLQAIRNPFPTTPFVPVGGVDANSAPAYLAAGAVAVGMGSPLVGDAASGGSLDALRNRVRSIRTALEIA